MKEVQAKLKHSCHIETCSGEGQISKGENEKAMEKSLILIRSINGKSFLAFLDKRSPISFFKQEQSKRVSGRRILTDEVVDKNSSVDINKNFHFVGCTTVILNAGPKAKRPAKAIVTSSRMKAVIG